MNTGGPGVWNTTQKTEGSGVVPGEKLKFLSLKPLFDVTVYIWNLTKLAVQYSTWKILDLSNNLNASIYLIKL